MDPLGVDELTQEGALHLPLQPPDLARLTSAAPGPASPILARGEHSMI